ncbi:MAG: trypsin-like serine protease [Acidobacteria bacterium]|nr:trypsin-like serine protease [Acidobacteriota bacterium]
MRNNLVRAPLVTALVAAALLAVQFGVPDGNAHPYVGLVVFYDTGGTPLWRCTGTLMTPTVFLTAAHCTEGPAVRAQVWFDSKVASPPYPNSGGIMGTPHPHPGWNGSLTIPNTHDVGVVILDKKVRSKVYGQLPTLGALDGLATQRGLQEVSFTVVGYGLQGVKPEYLSARERYRGVTRIVNLGSALTDGYNIQFSNNPGNWSGGTCFGDSGGPNFMGDTNIVAAVTSFGLNQNCAGTGFGFRTDITETRSFLASYGVSVP